MHLILCFRHLDQILSTSTPLSALTADYRVNFTLNPHTQTVSNLRYEGLISVQEKNRSEDGSRPLHLPVLLFNNTPSLQLP